MGRLGPVIESVSSTRLTGAADMRKAAGEARSRAVCGTRARIERLGGLLESSTILAKRSQDLMERNAPSQS